MRDPHTVAAIARALRHVHGDDTARAMLTNGTTLAAIIDALLHSSLANRDAVKLMTRALSSNDFIVTPDFSPVWHIKYIYDRPKSLNVVDLAVITLDHGTFASTDIRLHLAIDGVVNQREIDDAGAAFISRMPPVGSCGHADILAHSGPRNGQRPGLLLTHSGSQRATLSSHC